MEEEKPKPNEEARRRWRSRFLFHGESSQATAESDIQINSIQIMMFDPGHPTQSKLLSDKNAKMLIVNKFFKLLIFSKYKTQ